MDFSKVPKLDRKFKKGKERCAEGSDNLEVTQQDCPSTRQQTGWQFTNKYQVEKNNLY